MKIRVLNSVEWEAILKEVPSVTFFERPVWYRIWAQYLTARTSTFLIDDDILVTLLDLKGAKGLIKFRNSGPAGTYSNLQSLSQSYMSAAKLNQIIAKLKISHIRLSPYYDIEKTASAVLDHTTRVLNLLLTDDPRIHWSRNHLRQLRKARSGSIEIRKATQEDWLSYYKIYKTFIKLKGDSAGNRYNYHLFTYFCQLPDHDCTLWVAVDDARVVAGKIVFYQGTHAVEWHGTAVSDAAQQGVNQLLTYDILVDAKTRGISLYDFNPSGGHSTVEGFKSKFGASSVLCPVIKNYSLLQQWYLRYVR